MARGDQLARQWKIIQVLFSATRGKPVMELAEEVSGNWRTVYRDLEALQLAGFPVYTERINGKACWMLLDTAKNSPPIPFTLPELMALYFCSDVAKTFQGSIFSEALESLFEKIKTTLPEDSTSFLENIRRTLTVSKKFVSQGDKINGIIANVNEAALNKTVVEIVYFTMSRQEETRRRVNPYCLWYFKDSFYLIGYCHVREDLRVFALDRIKEFRHTEETFSVPESFDPEELMGSSFGIFKGAPSKVVVRFDADVAGYIEERRWHETQRIFYEDGGSILLKMVVAGIEEVKHWILTWGAKAEVLEPTSLREQIVAEGKAMVERYSKN
jgi:predicted DNA-binding transcriptional regulator YafY